MQNAECRVQNAECRMQSAELENATVRIFISVGVGALCQEQDCKQLCKRIVYTLVFDVYALEAERSEAERGFQKRRAA